MTCARFMWGVFIIFGLTHNLVTILDNIYAGLCHAVEWAMTWTNFDRSCNVLSALEVVAVLSASVVAGRCSR